MIIDFSISNFLSLKDEQIFNFNVEICRNHLPCNYSDYEDGKLRVLRTLRFLGLSLSECLTP